MKPIFVARGSEQLGQFSEQEITEGLESGRFLTTDLWWKEGMEEWQPLSSFRSRSFVPAIPTWPTSPGEVSHPSAVSPPAETDFPWEMSGVGLVKRWWETTIGALFSPVTTFAGMPASGGYGAPLLYAVISGALGGIMVGLVQLVFQTIFAAAGAGSGEGAAAAGGAALLCSLPIMLVSSLIGAVIGAILGAFVGGGITHLFLMLFGAAGKGYEATVRAICYAGGAVNGLYLIPVLGWIAAFFWGPVVYVISLRQAHQTDYWRVICAFLLWFLICCGATVGISMIFGGLIAAMSTELRSTTP
ncbi:MAG: hypothetical protein Fur0032_20740 [Terrimicrobiaceae bacterium]